MNYTVKSGDDLLRLPFFVNDKGLFPGEREALIKLLNETLGAAFFRDKALYLCVLEEMIEENESPFAYHRRERYHHVWFDSQGRLRMSPAFHVAPGSTVYALSKIEELVGNLSDLPLRLDDTC